MKLVSLYVCSELDFAMVGIVDFRPDDNTAWAHGIRNAPVGRKTIEPEYAIVNQFNGDTRWEALKR